MLNPQEIFIVNSLRQASISKKLNINILPFSYYYQNAVKILKSARLQTLSELYFKSIYIMIQKESLEYSS